MLVAQAILTRCFLKPQNPNLQTKDKQTQFLQVERPILQIKQSHPQVSSKCVQLGPTHQLLDDVPLTDTFAWNSLIRYHIRSEGPDDAISIYHQMLIRGVFPDKYTYPLVLAASLHTGGSFYGRQIHAHAVKWGFGSDNYVMTGLMTVYGQFDLSKDARLVFDKMRFKNSVAWTLLVGLYIAAD